MANDNDALERVELRIRDVKTMLQQDIDSIDHERKLLGVLDVLHRERKRLRIAAGLEKKKEGDE